MAKGKSSSDGGKLSPDTVITKDNIHQVLEHLDIDPSNYTEYDTPVETNHQKITVGHLQKILKQSKEQPKEIKIKKTIKNPHKNKNPYQKNLLSLASSTGTKTVDYTFHYTPYDITYIQTGRYYIDRRYDTWTSAGGSNASISSNSPVSIYKILNMSFNAYVENSYSYDSVLRQKSDITIGEYVGFSWGNVKVAESQLHGDVSWDASYIY